jgi:hypothetical protein
MPDSIGSVAGADAAGETPREADRTQQTVNETKPADGSESRPEQPRQTVAPQSEQAKQQATAPAPEQRTVDADHAQADSEQPPDKPGFGERGRMRRRARFLRKARELAYRDLGGLVFDLHRFGQRNDPLVLAKLAMLRQLDTELRELERVLREGRPVTVLREVGIAACPRCAAIHGSDDRFCPGCGLAFDTNADRPISTAPMAPQPPATNAQPVVATPAPAPTPPAPTPVTSSSIAPRAAPVPAKAHGHDEEQTQILRPPAKAE